MKKDVQTREKFIELRAMGWSYDRISTELKISRATLITWSKYLKLELANAKAVAQDGLLETFRLQRNERVRFLGAEFVKAREELAGRELKDMPTEKLLDYTLKLLTAVKADCPSHTEFQGEIDLVEDLTGTQQTKWEG